MTFRSSSMRRMVPPAQPHSAAQTASYSTPLWCGSAGWPVAQGARAVVSIELLYLRNSISATSRRHSDFLVIPRRPSQQASSPCPWLSATQPSSSPVLPRQSSGLRGVAPVGRPRAPGYTRLLLYLRNSMSAISRWHGDILVILRRPPRRTSSPCPWLSGTQPSASLISHTRTHSHRSYRHSRSGACRRENCVVT